MYVMKPNSSTELERAVEGRNLCRAENQHGPADDEEKSEPLPEIAPRHRNESVRQSKTSLLDVLPR